MAETIFACHRSPAGGPRYAVVSVCIFRVRFMSVRPMVLSIEGMPTRKEHEMIEFALTARGLYVRFHLAPETLVLILILARLFQRLL